MTARSFCLLCVAALLASLGPVRADTPPKKEKKERSPYAGTFTGTFTAMNAGGDQEGEFTLTVDDDGNVTGESINKTTNTTAKIKGTILKDNKVAMIYEFPDGQKANAYGTIAKNSKGGASGTLTQRIGMNFVCSIEFESAPKAK